MDKAITTALMIMISVVMALMLFNVAYPAIVEGGDAISSMANRQEARLRTEITIIHGAGELDSTGWWQDTNGNGDFEVFVWVKNVGSKRITAMERTDVFFGPEGNFVRIPHQSASGGLSPYWTGTLEGASDWDPSVTLKITIHYAFPLTSGRYFAKAIVSSGVADDYYWGM